MTYPRHRDLQARDDFERLSGRSDLGLNPRGAKQEVDQDSRPHGSRRQQAHRGDPSGGVLQDGVDLVAPRLEIESGALGLLIPCDGDHHVDLKASS